MLADLKHHYPTKSPAQKENFFKKKQVCVALKLRGRETVREKEPLKERGLADQFNSYGSTRMNMVFLLLKMRHWNIHSVPNRT